MWRHLWKVSVHKTASMFWVHVRVLRIFANSTLHKEVHFTKAPPLCFWSLDNDLFVCRSIHSMNYLGSKKSKTTIISLLVDSGPPDKYSYEIGQSFTNPLTVPFLDPSIKGSSTMKVVFVCSFQSEFIL